MHHDMFGTVVSIGSRTKPFETNLSVALVFAIEKSERMLKTSTGKQLKMAIGEAMSVKCIQDIVSRPRTIRKYYFNNENKDIVTRSRRISVRAALLFFTTQQETTFNQSYTSRGKSF